MQIHKYWGLVRIRPSFAPSANVINQMHYLLIVFITSMVSLTKLIYLWQDLAYRMIKLRWNNRVNVDCEQWTPATKVAKIQRAFFSNWMLQVQLKKKHLKQGLPKLKQQLSPVRSFYFNWISTRNKGCQNSNSTPLLLDAHFIWISARNRGCQNSQHFSSIRWSVVSVPATRVAKTHTALVSCCLLDASASTE